MPTPKTRLVSLTTNKEPAALSGITTNMITAPWIDVGEKL